MAENWENRKTSPYMRPAEAAEYVRLSVSTLAQMRVEQRGPKYFKAGGRVLYRLSDLEEWVESRIYVGTGSSLPKGASN
ncbi:Helix-turn-helix domain protein [Methyloligella halotolerans]|uniref:Helix-turn-helix domain protein n=1 Tax=Methyloligella halotolerans TaxID=1177755 RepID=A0A1E2RVC7_9HYPH|nr:helix-turn-helix domain-containing protein [Methyloligella halotolerans]ODA66048.1 Helix-turn-helix domain protein [Methyloligella halotolerans]